MKIKLLNINILTVCSLFLGSSVNAQSILDVCNCDGSDGTITAVSEPGTMNDTTNTQVYFITGNDTIIQVNGSGTFNGIPTGTYDVYALNYDPTDLNVSLVTDNIEVGDTILNYLTVGDSTDPCYSLAAGAASVNQCDGDTETLLEDEAICDGEVFSFGGVDLSASGIYTDTLVNASGCDSVLVLNLSVLDNVSTSIDTTICDGEIFTFNGTDYTASDSFSEIFTGANTCDSTVNVTLNVLNNTTASVDTTICDGETFTFNGTDYTASTSFSEIFTGANTCDSIVNVNLIVLNNGMTVIDTTICDGETYSFNGTDYSTTQTIVETLGGAANGCSEEVTINLTVIDPIEGIEINASICSGATYTLPDGIEVNAAGTYDATLTSSTGCDSLVTTILSVDLPLTSTLDANICQGETYTLPDGTEVMTAGSYDSNLSTAEGCDSIVTVNLTVDFCGTASILDVCNCDGSDATIVGISEPGTFNMDNTQIYVLVNAAGLVVDINTDGTGAFNNVSTGVYGIYALNYDPNDTNVSTVTDALVIGNDLLSMLTIGVSADPCYELSGAANASVNQCVLDGTTSIDVEICEGESYTFDGQDLTVAGTYSAMTVTVDGCNSTEILNLTVASKVFTTIDTTLCFGEIYEYNGTQYTETGNYVVNPDGVCEEVTINLTVLDDETMTLDETICEGEVYTLDGVDYDASGTYTATVTTASGCESTITLTLTVLSLGFSTIDTTICFGQSYMFNGSTYDATGTYTEMVVNAGSCNEAVTINLTVLDEITTDLTISICEGEVYSFDGTDYDATGTYNATLTSVAGCDSLVTLSLTVSDMIMTTIDETICSGETYSYNGTDYTESGTYTQNITGTGTCDEVVTINLTVETINTLFIDEVICQGQTYTFNGVDYTESGNYMQTITNPGSCDEEVFIGLTVVEGDMVEVNESICEGESYTFDGMDYAESGSYSATFTNSIGCDSTVTLILTVSDLLAFTLTAVQPTCDTPTGTVTLDITTTGFNYGISEGSTFSGNADIATQDGVNEIADLAPGSYVVRVETAEGCSADQAITLVAPTDCEPNPNITDICPCNGDEATIISIAQPGTFNEVDHTQIYILADQTGNILASANDGTFDVSALADGFYEVFALNYANADAAIVEAAFVNGQNVNAFVAETIEGCYSILGPQVVSINALDCLCDVDCSTINAPLLSDLTVCEGSSTLVDLLGAACSKPFFSEYLEGSSSNKALEIYNPTGQSIDLSNFRILEYGNSSSGAVFIDTLDLSGMLQPGDVYAIVNDAADPALQAEADILLDFPSVVHFNGNDALVLVDLANDIICDVIGVPGENPGSSWTAGTGATNENTLVRDPSITQGTDDWSAGQTQWIVLPQNDFSNFGSHNFSPAPCFGIAYNFYGDEALTDLLASGVQSYDPMTAAGSSTTLYVTTVSGACETAASSVSLNVINAPTATLQESVIVCNVDDGANPLSVDLNDFILDGPNNGAGTWTDVFGDTLTTTKFSGDTLVVGSSFAYTYTVNPLEGSPCNSNSYTLTLSVENCSGDPCQGIEDPNVDDILLCGAGSTELMPFGGGINSRSVTEDFNMWGDGSYGTASNYIDPTGGMWESFNSITDASRARTGNAVRFNDDSGANEYLQYNGFDGNGKDNGIGSVSFWYRHWNGNGSAVAFLAQYSEDAGANWMNIGDTTEVSSEEYMQFFEMVNVTGDNLLFRIISVEDGERMLIDDLTITDASDLTYNFYADAALTTLLASGSSYDPMTAAGETDSVYVTAFIDGCESGAVGASVALFDAPSATVASSAVLCLTENGAFPNTIDLNSLVLDGPINNGNTIWSDAAGNLIFNTNINAVDIGLDSIAIYTYNVQAAPGSFACDAVTYDVEINVTECGICDTPTAELNSGTICMDANNGIASITLTDLIVSGNTDGIFTDSDGNVVTTADGSLGFGAYTYTYTIDGGADCPSNVYLVEVTVEDCSFDFCSGFVASTVTECGSLTLGLYNVLITIDGGNPGENGYTVTNNLDGTSQNITGPIFQDVGLTIGDGFSYTITVVDHPECIITSSNSAVDCTTTEVELLEFVGKVKDEGNLLYWATATERNNEAFLLMHSTDGRHFEVLNKQAGAGNSGTTLNYDYLHEDASYGYNYYRLDQQDVDGVITESRVITLWRSLHNDGGISLQPIPTRDFINLTFSSRSNGNVIIEIFDAVGRLVEVQEMGVHLGQNRIEFNVVHYPN